jgi:hypothetical protein
MKSGNISVWLCTRGLVLTILFLIAPLASNAMTDETFDVLHVGTRTYTNVTVTTKTRTQIFIMHSAGMHTIKVADLPPEILSKLGYSSVPEEKPTKGLAALGTAAKKSGVKFSFPQFKQFQGQLGSHKPVNFAAINWSTNALLTISGIVVLFYLFFSYCAMLICQKAGEMPGPLVWVPFLQLIPLLKAAQMPAGWIILFLIPGLNIIAHIVWSMKIASARGKGPLTGLCLILPITSFFAFLYLAFSNGAVHKERTTVEIMSLEAA